MRDQDRARIRANIQWFNQFFEGIRNIYDILADGLPEELFPAVAALSSDCFHFPRLKVVPSIPPYYAFLLAGPKHGLQVLTIVDAHLIARDGPFASEPSIIPVLHSNPDKNSRVDDLGLKVIKNHALEFVHKKDNMVSGHIQAPHPADFFAFQVSLDHFSDIQDTEQAVQRYLLAPIMDHLRRDLSIPSP